MGMLATGSSMSKNQYARLFILAVAEMGTCLSVGFPDAWSVGSAHGAL
jgi:hypothetical protein